MLIREATEADTGEIVALLKLSLGENLMPKSERYWKWKHHENPFGSSPVLLCWEGSELIGVRAFMRWEWSSKGQVYRAVRAVDTATHPSHQGKSVFKKLTLSLVDYCKERGDHFVFNTPNHQSKPGYLKMGWKEAGKVPVQIGMRRPLNMLKNFFSIARNSKDESENNSIKYYLEHLNLGGLVEEHRQQTEQIITNISVPYLIWRYIDVPVSKYVAIGEERGEKLTSLIICRIKETRLGRELRITDCFLNEDSSGKELIRKLRESSKVWGIDYTTLSGTGYARTKKIIPSFSFKASVGPMVTIRSLIMTDLHLLETFKQWSPSLGDLELF